MLTIVLENKIGRYWYKNDFGKMLLDPDLIKIADEICNEYVSFVYLKKVIYIILQTIFP